MLKSLKQRLYAIDVFPYNPEQALVFNKKKLYPTLTGATWTIVLFTAMSVLWAQQFYLMFNYLSGSIQESITTADFNELGI